MYGLNVRCCWLPLHWEYHHLTQQVFLYACPWIINWNAVATVCILVVSLQIYSCPVADYTNTSWIKSLVYHQVYQLAQLDFVKCFLAVSNELPTISSTAGNLTHWPIRPCDFLRVHILHFAWLGLMHGLKQIFIATRNVENWSFRFILSQWINSHIQENLFLCGCVNSLKELWNDGPNMN